MDAQDGKEVTNVPASSPSTLGGSSPALPNGDARDWSASADPPSQPRARPMPSRSPSHQDAGPDLGPPVPTSLLPEPCSAASPGAKTRGLSAIIFINLLTSAQQKKETLLAQVLHEI